MQHSNYDPAQLEVHKQPLNMGHTEFQSQIACPHRKSNHRTYCQKLSFYQESKQSYVLRSSSCCFSVAHLCPTLCDPMDCSTPGFPVHHLLELAQTHVHWVSDAIQPSLLLLSLSTPAINLSQHQGLFYWDGSSHQVAKVLEMQFQHQSFLRIFMIDFL